MPQHIDRPEPRGQVIAAVLAIGAIYLALPRNVVVGPIWLLPTVIVVLLVPTVVSHRVGKQSLNRLLGFIINGITTVALIGSVILLVRLLPTHRESPLQLLRSGGLLWLTNVIVFALWYWRLDGGGPTLDTTGLVWDVSGLRPSEHCEQAIGSGSVATALFAVVFSFAVSRRSTTCRLKSKCPPTTPKLPSRFLRCQRERA